MLFQEENKEDVEQTNKKIGSEILILYQNQSKLGLSHFSNHTGIISIFNVYEYTEGNFERTISLLNELNYSTLLIPKNLSLNLKNAIYDIKNNANKHINVITVKKINFAVENCEKALMQLSLEKSEPNQNNVFLHNHAVSSPDVVLKKKLILNCLFDRFNPETLQSTGSLVYFLIQQSIINSDFCLENLIVKNIEKKLYINRKTMESLQIFKEEVHPSLIKGKGRSKEGFSLYNLFESQVTTAQGHKLMKKWFMNPTYDDIIIKNRLNNVENLMAYFNKEDIKVIKKTIGKIYDFASLLEKFQNIKSKYEDWKKIKYSFENLLKLIAFIKNHKNLQFLRCKPILDLLASEMQPISYLNAIIQKCLRIGDEKVNSKTLGFDLQIEINYGINEELDFLRNSFYQLDDFLESYAKNEMLKLRNKSSLTKISSIAFSFLPQVGYMILVPKEDSFPTGALFSKNKNRTTISSKKHESGSPIKSKRKVFDLKSNLMHSRKNLEYLDFLASTNNPKNPHLSSSNAYNSNIKMEYEKIYQFNNNKEKFAFNNINNNSKNCKNHNNRDEFNLQLEHMHDLKTNYQADFFISSNEKTNFGREKRKNELKISENMNSDKIFGFNTENTNNFGFAIPEESEYEEEGEEIDRGDNREKKGENEIYNDGDQQEESEGGIFEEDDGTAKDLSENTDFNIKNGVSLLKKQLPHRRLYHQSLELDEDWDFHFEMNNFLYFKNSFTNELDNAYGDIYEQIINLEQEILRNIEAEILKIYETLINFNTIVAELDCYLAYSLIAIDFFLIKPDISFDSMILIKEGRHLLTEIMVKEQFISNDHVVYNYIDEYDNNFESNEHFLINKNYSNRCSILSGPNFSGKSIFLKQIGLIVFMVHIGSFVPAKYCKIGLFDKILTSIHLSDSLSCNQTGLSEEIQNIIHITKAATNRSLVLIDEFGKNASHEESLALFMTIAKFLTNPFFNLNQEFEVHSKNPCLNDFKQDFRFIYEQIPTSILVTHLKEILNERLLVENYLIRFLNMRFVFKDDNANIFEKEGNHSHAIKNFNSELNILYLYKMSPGFAKNSYAIYLAKNIIREEWIIRRAFEIHKCINLGEEVKPIQEISNMFLNTTKNLIENIKNS